MGEENKVSVWMGMSIDEENDLIGLYDHDYAEGGFSLDHFSYAKSYADAVKEVAKKYSDTYESQYYFLLLGYDAKLQPGEIDPTKFKGVLSAPSLDGVEINKCYYLGSFDFSRE